MVAVFIFGFLNAMRCVSITLDPLPGDTEPCVLSWVSADVNNQNVGIITAPASIFNIGGLDWGANPNVYPAFTKQLLSARLKLYQTINFTLLADAKLNSVYRTAEFRVGGKWLQAFGLNPAYKDMNNTNTGGSSLCKKLTKKFVDKLWAQSKLRDPILAMWLDMWIKASQWKNEEMKTTRKEHNMIKGP